MSFEASTLPRASLPGFTAAPMGRKRVKGKRKNYGNRLRRLLSDTEAGSFSCVGEKSFERPAYSIGQDGLFYIIQLSLRVIHF
jgi:hypothetical protein